MEDRGKAGSVMEHGGDHSMSLLGNELARRDDTVKFGRYVLLGGGGNSGNINI